MTRTSKSPSFLSILSTLSVALLFVGCDAADEELLGAPPAPYTGLIVYVADGVWDPAGPDDPSLTLAETQREVWGLSEAEIEAFEAETTAFYAQRFGIDLDLDAPDASVQIRSFGCDPRLAYRVVAMAGREVPPEGWPVCDAGYLLTVVDPDGLELGGELAGSIAPAGASMAFGRYQIETDAEPLTVAFKAVTPYLSDPYGDSAIHCELDSPELGHGEAYLVFSLDQLMSGEFAVTIRNVLTFAE